MTTADPAALMREAAQALRSRTRAVPGFSPSVIELLDMTAEAGTSITRERRDVTLRLAQEVLGAGQDRTNDEGNETMQTPTEAKAGDKIEHELMPGFPMTVEDAEPCETDGTRSEPHQQYQVTDPEGNTDWLCAYDVQKVA